MPAFRVGIIGCGRPWGSEGATGSGQAHVHVAGYLASPDCEIVAAADISQGNLDAFCDRYGIPGRYTDSEEMLSREHLDIVSVCVWPKLHAPMTIAAARAGVRAVHCEKPIAPTWGEAREMVQVCAERGVQLTFNHQRRFGTPFRKAKKLLDSGAIGQLTRLEAFTGNLYDWGTHWFDMMFMYNDEEPAEWVIGQIDARGGYRIFDVSVEGQGVSLFRWGNGVYGLMATGGQGQFDCGNRIIGTEGVIEVWVRDGPVLRMKNLETSGEWVDYDVGERDATPEHNVSAVLDLVDALKTGREPELSARRALQSTEIIFATYESSRRRGRVDLPLEIEDSPLQAMLDAGEVSVVDERPTEHGWVQGDVIANRMRIHYYRTKGDGPPLVLSHGFSDNGMCWLRVAQALEGEYDVIMPDARGHGGSRTRGRAYDDVTRAADLARFAMALGLARSALIGHSMGAATTATAAANYPDLFPCIVLEDPPWFDPDSPLGQWSTLPVEERLAQMGAQEGQIEARKSRSLEEIMAEGRAEGPTWDEAELRPWAEAKRQLSPDATEFLRCEWPAWREVIPRLKCPTLLVTGDPERGAIVTPEVAQQAAAMNPLIEVVRLDGAGHNVRREQFERFVEAVTAFLSRHYRTD